MASSLFVSILDEMNVRVWYPHRAYMPTLTNFRHSRTIAELDDIVRQIVRTRRAEVEARGDGTVEGRSTDLLGAWLCARGVPVAWHPRGWQWCSNVRLTVGGTPPPFPPVPRACTDMLLASKVLDEDAPDGTAATGMSDAQLCDELKTMLLAGHETSSMALTWAVCVLAVPRGTALAPACARPV